MILCNIFVKAIGRDFNFSLIISHAPFEQVDPYSAAADEDYKAGSPQ